jgi:hypothetical protein
MSRNSSTSCFLEASTLEEVQTLKITMGKAITKAIASGDENEPLVLTSREAFILKCEERVHNVTSTSLATRLKLSQVFGKVLNNIIENYGDIILLFR